MRLFFIVGERSGDLHASNLIKSLVKIDPEVQYSGFGGELMQEAGMELRVHYSEYSMMGFTEVVLNYKKIKKYLKRAQEELLISKAEAVVLVDFGGFNMRMAKFAKSKGIKVIYYIPPKVWAWNTSRAYKLKENVDLLLSILPFEKAFYTKFDYDISYVGNPVNDAVRAFLEAKKPGIQNSDHSKRTIALLPGSRLQELKKIKPLLLNLIKEYKDYRFLIAGVDNLDQSVYREFEKMKNVEVRFNSTYELLSEADAAVVTSGTATLETALLNIPQVVVYIANSISYQIGKRVVKVDHISLVNLILNRPLLKELIQREATVGKIKEELDLLLNNAQHRKEILQGYEVLQSILGTESASEKAATEIYSYLN